jgi:hypothetical protein
MVTSLLSWVLNNVLLDKAVKTTGYGLINELESCTLYLILFSTENNPKVMNQKT